MSKLTYGKIQGIYGENVLISQLPLIFKRLNPKSYHLGAQENSNNTTNKPQEFYVKSQANQDDQILAILDFDRTVKHFVLRMIVETKIDDKTFSEGSHHQLTSLNKIFFPNVSNEIFDIYYVILNPGLQVVNANKQKNLTNNRGKFIDRLHLSKWTFEERELLKKVLLLYGHGRWKKIKENKQIGSSLDSKPILEVQGYANSFIRSIIDNITYEKRDLKKFLYTIIDDDSIPYVVSSSKDWDINLIRQRAAPWAKRIQLLQSLQKFIKRFKNECKQKSINIDWNYSLSFIPSAALCGQKPSVWWTKKHDIDLLLGTYKYGYANYQMMRSSPEFSLNELDNSSSFQEFPNSDMITRRLKKLIQIIDKFEDHPFSFETVVENDEDLADWTESEFQNIVTLLTDYGVPLTNDGKFHFSELVNKFNTTYLPSSHKNVLKMEKIVQKIRAMCQNICQNACPTGQTMEEEKNCKFQISTENAQKCQKNMNILNFIRKTILINNRSLFKTFQDELKACVLELPPTNPAFINDQNYTVEINDLTLLVCVAENGFNSLLTLPGNALYGFENINLDEQKLMSRVEFICEFFKNTIEKNNKKKRTDKPFKDDSKKKKLSIQRDECGGIIYPIHINNSLRILNIGTIKLGPNYHSEHNLFPVNFKSVRNYASIFNKLEKAEYTCEILDGGEKPIYKVTSSEDPSNPIIKDSSTGCWSVICKKVNELQDVKKQKVTISGTERFGLIEPNVVKLLESLPNAEKCEKYAFKYKQQQQKCQKKYPINLIESIIKSKSLKASFFISLDSKIINLKKHILQHDRLLKMFRGACYSRKNNNRLDLIQNEKKIKQEHFFLLLIHHIILYFIKTFKNFQ